MVLLNNLLFDQVLKFIEAELVKYEPEMQAALLAEIQDLLAKGVQWVEGKLHPQPAKE